MEDPTNARQGQQRQRGRRITRSKEQFEYFTNKEFSPDEIMKLREDLQNALNSYTKETFSHIHTLKKFCEGISDWTKAREAELKEIKSIKAQFEKTQGSWNLLSRAGNQTTLRQKLDAELKKTVAGFQKLHCFLDAVKKMAVTSPHVFTEEQQIEFNLPTGVSLKHVQNLIKAAQESCPWLLCVNRDVISSFFLPKLRYLEVIPDELEEDIKIIKKICDKLKRSLPPQMSAEAAAALGVGFSDDNMKSMLSHFNELVKIREDQHFWTVFLFQDGTESEFISEFEKRQSSLQQLVEDLEEIADQLDSMNKGEKISSMTGSSIGATGSALNFARQVLSPVTAGASLALTATGAGLGVGANETQQNRANKILHGKMEDLQRIQDCLQQVISPQICKTDTSQKDRVAATGAKANSTA